MKPVVLIATHNRKEITSKCVESLMKQSVQPKVVLVVSDKDEFDFYKKKFHEADVCLTANRPLGAKWQHGVNHCKRLNPDPLIICGSDDILGVGFIENACVLIKSGIDFIGLSRWHVLSDDVLFTYDYNASIPLGGGRCYSNKALMEIGFKVFDSSIDKHLDDNGWKRINSTTLSRVTVRDVEKEGLNIVSIKGSWPMMNPFEKFIGNRNVNLVSKSRDKADLQKLINYG